MGVRVINQITFEIIMPTARSVVNILKTGFQCHFDFSPERLF